MLSWLNDTAITLLGEPASWAELLGFVTGLACVWLVVREHVANWPLGIANVILLGAAFLTAHLYADAALQIVYIVLNAYGWWAWVARTPRTGGLQLRIGRTSRMEWLWLTVSGLAACAVMYAVLRQIDDSAPLADAATTALSLVATYGQCRKLIENWWVWIAADVIYIPMYAYKHLYLTTVLYAAFLCLCVAGLVQWYRRLRVEATSASPVAGAEPATARQAGVPA